MDGAGALTKAGLLPREILRSGHKKRDALFISKPTKEAWYGIRRGATEWNPFAPRMVWHQPLWGCMFVGLIPFIASL